MLSDADKLSVRTIVEEVIEEKTNSIENKIDQVLSIVTRTDQEHLITQARVNQHDKRLRIIEKKLEIVSPSSSSLA